MKILFKVLSGIVSFILLVLVFANFNMILTNDSIPNILGYSYVAEYHNNMSPDIEANDLVIIKTNMNDLDVNDIVAYKSNDDILINRLYITDGDNCQLKDNIGEEVTIKCSQIVGKKINKINNFSFIAPLTTTPKGFIFIVILAVVLAFFKHSKKEIL